MNRRVAGLALLSAIGIGLAVTSCGSATGTAKPPASATGAASGGTASSSPASASPAASSAASSSPGSVPAGYTRIGGAEQGISIAAPASWVALNLDKVSAQVAASKISTTATSNATLVQDIEKLQKLHAVAVWDVKSAVNSPQQFARNLNAYCVHPTGITVVGAASVPQLRAAVAQEYEQQGMTHITQQDLTIGGVPGVETSYQVTSPTEGTIYGSQLEVLPKPNEICSVSLAVGAGESAGNILSTAAATAQFP